MLKVLGFTAVAGGVALVLYGGSAGLWTAFAALLVTTMVTVPTDLQDGEYDNFGCGLMLAIFAVWFVAEVVGLSV